MRVLRIVVGILSLLLAMPVLAAGAVGWWAMQHRSPDGSFRADLAAIVALPAAVAEPASPPPGEAAAETVGATGDAPEGSAARSRVLVVPDVDAILRRDAPFARADRTEFRLVAGQGVFLGMAPPADVAGYLTGVDYTEISGVSLGRGPLAVASRHVAAAGEPIAVMPAQRFWLRNAEGELRWAPAADRDRHLALLIVAPPGDEPLRLSVSVTAGWLDSTTWGLLILGPVLLLAGLVALAWPHRTREIVYVVGDPSPVSLRPSLSPATHAPVLASFADRAHPCDAEGRRAEHCHTPGAEPAMPLPGTLLDGREMPFAGHGWPDPEEDVRAGHEHPHDADHPAWEPVTADEGAAELAVPHQSRSFLETVFAGDAQRPSTMPVVPVQPSHSQPSAAEAVWPPTHPATATEPPREISAAGQAGGLPSAGLQLHLSAPD